MIKIVEPNFFLQIAGGTTPNIRIGIVSRIGIDIELAIIGIPVGIHKTGAVTLVALYYPYNRGNYYIH